VKSEEAQRKMIKCCSGGETTYELDSKRLRQVIRVAKKIDTKRKQHDIPEHQPETRVSSFGIHKRHDSTRKQITEPWLLQEGLKQAFISLREILLVQ
jgi:hypothetical protein